MQKIMICVIIMFLFAGCTDNDSNNQNIVKEMIDVMQEVRTNLEAELGHEVPSINVYMQTSDDIFFASAASSENEQLTKETYFRFASNTKSFTATAILNMHEDNWLDIYDTIVEIIPDYNIYYVPDTAAWEIPYKDEITIEELLQHSAGVYDVDNDVVPDCDDLSFVQFTHNNDPNHQFTAEELVEQVTINELSYFEPGTDHHYSNTGYTILSEIIARVYSAHAGMTKTYADYLNDYIVGSNSDVPLDIHFPCTSDDVSLPNPHANGIIYYEEGQDPIEFDQTNMSAHVAEGNGYSNFVNLNRYVRTLMTGQNVLDAATIELMQTDISPGNDSYGLGCLHATNLGFGHNGCIRGYFSLMVYDPDYDVSLIAMMPMVDQKTYDNFVNSFYGMYTAAWKAREILGYPGVPETRINLEKSMAF